VGKGRKNHDEVANEVSEVLLKIGGVPVYQDGDGSVHWVGEMTIDADGSPRAYGPEGCSPKPLDYLANAGYPGNWWGIVTDGYGEPYEQELGDPARWPWPGLYLSTTAYVVPNYGKYDARHYVDSEHVAFMVVPGNVRMSVPPKFMGCRAQITDLASGKVLDCVCADVGPSNHLGEASMAAAKFFGLDPNPKSGGSSDRERWQYRCWPGVEAKGYVLQ
jgi:hypothetical protein